MKKFKVLVASFLLSLIAFSVSFAAVPTRVTPEVTEINSAKVAEPSQEDEFSKLNSIEGRYAESWDQQQRLRSATKRVAGSGYSTGYLAPRAKVVSRNSAVQQTKKRR